jgi:hypothetical protein
MRSINKAARPQVAKLTGERDSNSKETTCHIPDRRSKVRCISERQALHRYATFSTWLANKSGVTCVTVISPLQFGQISIAGTMEDISLVLMIFPFTQRNARRQNSPGSGAHESEKQELGIVPVALRQRLDHQQRAPIIRESRGKVTELVTIFLAGR